MTSAPTLTPLRLSLTEARFIESEEVDYHEFLAWRWQEIDRRAEDARMHRAVRDFGRARRDRDHRDRAWWSAIIAAWLLISILIIRR